MKHNENLISAHHNYLVNGMLSPGFVLGDPNSGDDFYFLADLVLPGEGTPRISARMFDVHGTFLMELKWNRIGENPGNCSYKPTPDGFRILYSTGETLLEVKTLKFPNGYLTHTQGMLYDKEGKLRMEPADDGIRVNGGVRLALDSPFAFLRG